MQPEHLGKTYGVISLVVAAGTSAGPMVAGILFEVGGYWLAWSSAFAIILVDIVLRMLMLERPKQTAGVCCPLQFANSRTYDVVGSTGAGHDGSNPENDPLLGENRPMGEKTGWAFYAYILRHRRFVAGVISYLTFAALISSFDTTLPLHVRDVFGWGSMLSGMMFFALQGPGIILSPLCGWLKDRVGTRWPTTVGFLALIPVMWLLGTPGDDRFPWANGGQTGQVIYTVCVTMVGALTCLLNGAGTIEATGMNSPMSFLLSCRRNSPLCSDGRRDRSQASRHFRPQRGLLESFVVGQYELDGRLFRGANSIGVSGGANRILRNELCHGLVDRPPNSHCIC